MKKTSFFVMLMLVLCCGMATSCSDDDDDDNGGGGSGSSLIGYWVTEPYEGWNNLMFCRALNFVNGNTVLVYDYVASGKHWGDDLSTPFPPKTGWYYQTGAAESATYAVVDGKIYITSGLILTVMDGVLVPDGASTLNGYTKCDAESDAANSLAGKQLKYTEDRLDSYGHNMHTEYTFTFNTSTTCTERVYQTYQEWVGPFPDDFENRTIDNTFHMTYTYTGTRIVLTGDFNITFDKVDGGWKHSGSGDIYTMI